MGEPTGFFFGIMFLTVLMVGCFTYLDVWKKKQKKIIANMTPEEDVRQLKQEYANELSSLKQRIATLEKIVTDGQFDLKKEIEKLDVT